MEDFIKRIGLDKFAHFGIGGLIAASVLLVMMLQEIAAGRWSLLWFGFAGILVAAFASLVKEVADRRFDWRDIAAGVIGAAWLLVCMAIGIALSVWSYGS